MQSQYPILGQIGQRGLMVDKNRRLIFGGDISPEMLKICGFYSTQRTPSQPATLGELELDAVGE